MAKIIFLAFVAACVAGTMGDQPALPKDFNEFMAMTEKAFQDMTKHVGEMLPSGDKAQEVLDDMKNNANQIANSLKEGVAKLHDQVKDNPEVTKVVNDFQAKVEEAMDKLKADNPEMAANAEKLHEKMVASMNTLMTEVKKVEAEVSKEGGLKDTVEGIMKDFVEKSKEQYEKLEKTMHEKLGHGNH